MATKASKTSILIVALLVSAIWAAGDLSLFASSRELKAEDHPVAALAWAKFNCDETLELAPNAARTQTEVLLEAAAAFDAHRRERGRDQACDEARLAAAPAAVSSAASLEISMSTARLLSP